jgi:hypothetical protein
MHLSLVVVFATAGVGGVVAVARFMLAWAVDSPRAAHLE